MHCRTLELDSIAFGFPRLESWTFTVFAGKVTYAAGKVRAGGMDWGHVVGAEVDSLHVGHVDMGGDWGGECEESCQEDRKALEELHFVGSKLGFV